MLLLLEALVSSYVYAYRRQTVSEGTTFPELPGVLVSKGTIFPKLPGVQGIPILEILYLERG